MMNASAESVRAQILAILRAWGMEEDLAATTAEVMVETDLMGIDSHGLSMVMMYEKLRDGGFLRLDARPQVVRDRGCVALVDGGAGLGHPVAVMAMDLAIEKALTHGMGGVAVRNSHHFGAAGCYARRAPARGVIGLVLSSARTPLMVPTRASEPILGTNPIAFAAPAKRHRPFSLDMATTTVAGNKVKVYDLKRKPIPAGWVVDERGAPVTDSALAMEYMFRRPKGGITPLGGSEEQGSHKGYGLAMMAQILGGLVAGGSIVPDKQPMPPKGPDNVGHFFLALDPDAFREEGAFEDDLDTLIDTLHAAPLADPAKPMMVAGEPEDAARAHRLKYGIPVPESLEQHVRAICGRSGAPFLLAEVSP